VRGGERERLRQELALQLGPAREEGRGEMGQEKEKKFNPSRMTENMEGDGAEEWDSLATGHRSVPGWLALFTN
jgi:hypothetical protein